MDHLFDVHCGRFIAPLRVEHTSFLVKGDHFGLYRRLERQDLSARFAPFTSGRNQLFSQRAAQVAPIFDGSRPVTAGQFPCAATNKVRPRIERKGSDVGDRAIEAGFRH